MATRERDRTSRRRAGSGQRDAKHRAGGDWTTLTLPDGIEIFSPKEGTVKMDIVPFEVGEGNPYAKPGEWYYERTFYTHGRVGPNNESYVCPSKTTKKPCPICEFRSKEAANPDGDEKLVKDLKPKERQLFLIRVHGKDGPEEKVRLYESSFHTFGKLLDKLRQEAEEDEPHKTDFDDPKKGAVLKVGYTDKDAGGYSFVDCYSIEFKPRPNGLDEEVLDHGICLDDVVKIMSYDELKKAFLQEDKEADDDDEPAKSKPKGDKKPKSEPEDEEEEKEDDGPTFSVGQKVRHRQFGICVIKKITEDGLVLLGKDGTRHPGADPKNVRAVDEVPEEEEDDDKDRPTQRPAKSVKKGTVGTTARTSRSDDDEDMDEEEDRQERIPPKTKKTVQKNLLDDRDEEEDEPKPKKTKSKDEDDEEDDWDKEEKPSKSKKTTKRAKDEEDDEDDWG